MFSLPLSFMLAVLLIAVLPLQHQVRNIQMMIDDFIFSDPFKRWHNDYSLQLVQTGLSISIIPSTVILAIIPSAS